MVQKTIKVVSKTGGIIFTDEDGVWYNPSPKIKDTVLANASNLKGKTVEVELNDKFINSLSEVVDGNVKPIESKTFTPQSNTTPKAKLQSNYDEMFDNVIKAIKSKELTKDNIFDELATVTVPTYEKMGLKYIQWGDAHQFGKNIDNGFKYEAVPSDDGTPLFKTGNGGMVKVRVMFPTLGIDNEEFYPILNHSNKGISYENIMASDVNNAINAIQRGFVKVFSKTTGLGFYLNRGKNNPDDE